jgi:hypothetical protein
MNRGTKTIKRASFAWELKRGQSDWLALGGKGYGYRHHRACLARTAITCVPTVTSHDNSGYSWVREIRSSRDLVRKRQLGTQAEARTLV